jgi:hypothetical protein
MKETGLTPIEKKCYMGYSSTLALLILGITFNQGHLLF